MSKKTISVRLDLNRARIEELVTAAIQAAEDTAKFAEKTLIEDEVIPYRTGNLQRSMEVVSQKKGSFNIVFRANYADELYTDYRRKFNRTINSNAQAAWMDYLLTSKSNVILDYFAQSFRKRGNV